MLNSFGSRSYLEVDGKGFEIYSIKSLEGSERLPYALKILLENLLRHEDGEGVTADAIRALLEWSPAAESDVEVAFTPARVLLQDFTGVPAVVDLAAMRDAVRGLGGDPGGINPQLPVELVIDHSVQVDRYGTPDAFRHNAELEYRRNRERYEFLKWGQKSFSNFRVVPPDTGIVHQVNLEYLARTIFTGEHDGHLQAYPDTLVGTDSHTTMINGLGVLGWGVGGIEAEAAMLGQPISMLIPQVVGFRLEGELPEGATATDLVLIVVEMLRRKGVVGRFVEFFGDGLDHLTLSDRATIANMAPEYGATCGIFPIDDETLRYLRLTGREPEQVALVERYARAQGLFREAGVTSAAYSDTLELDLGYVEASLAGPKRPQDRIPLNRSGQQFEQDLATMLEGRGRREGRTATASLDGEDITLTDGTVVIAAITSCTNTSNPSVMLAAGLLAKSALERGLTTAPWVKSSLAPGSRVVTEYLRQAGLLEPLARLGFNLVGYGCTTCIGNSGPLPEPVSRAIAEGDLMACSVLSGNRNFEGRVHPEVRMNYLASPPLVVAYALAGRMGVDLLGEPLGIGNDGTPVYLKELWPSRDAIRKAIGRGLNPEQFKAGYARVFEGGGNWGALDSPEGELFEWQAASTYIKRPPFFDGMGREPEPVGDIEGARVLALLGDSVTTDHISPAGAIKPESPAGEYLLELGVKRKGFNSLGARRGNHEVMMRGTFANIRLRNQLAPGTEGGVTRHQPDGAEMSIYAAAMRYRDEGVPLLVIAGKEYGSGSSRDWAAKGPRLLGVWAVLAESFERIHRSNLVGMGLLPLQFMEGESAASLGLSGTERYTISGLDSGRAKQVTVTAERDNGEPIVFSARVRFDTPREVEYYRHGGILHYVLRRLASG